MHHRLFITFDKSCAKRSSDARRYAYNKLSNKWYGDPCIDWFVIGGRWTGLFTWAHRRTQTEVKGVNKRYQPYESTEYGEIESAKKHLRALMADTRKYVRNNVTTGMLRHDYGYNDDATIVSKEFYGLFLKEYEKENKEYYSELDKGFIDLDSDPVSQNFIDKKWLVVVDCHR